MSKVGVWGPVKIHPTRKNDLVMRRRVARIAPQLIIRLSAGQREPARVVCGSTTTEIYEH